jgi:hypothetical protein
LAPFATTSIRFTFRSCSLWRPITLKQFNGSPALARVAASGRNAGSEDNAFKRFFNFPRPDAVSPHSASEATSHVAGVGVDRSLSSDTRIVIFARLVRSSPEVSKFFANSKRVGLESSFGDRHARGCVASTCAGDALIVCFLVVIVGRADARSFVVVTVSTSRAPRVGIDEETCVDAVCRARGFRPRRFGFVTTSDER